ncbi:hypothetical protein EDD18DRAFT_1104533 [Armillaria luteobubalina]|uniref:Uncharacterized protein n=1 Tax=Armillaria luteobubalina TaxID=153913 RepID=A0AA39UYA8_9AGAR|nr:hypothetical protein EDD18DRAFT_1104533 [Armillaria luteobubalina]
MKGHMLASVQRSVVKEICPMDFYVNNTFYIFIPQDHNTSSKRSPMRQEKYLIISNNPCNERVNEDISGKRRDIARNCCLALLNSKFIEGTLDIGTGHQAEIALKKKASLGAIVYWHDETWMPVAFAVFAVPMELVLDMMRKAVEGFQDGCVNPPLTKNTLMDQGAHRLSSLNLLRIEHVEWGGQELVRLGGALVKGQAYRERETLVVYLEWAALAGVLLVAILEVVNLGAALLDEHRRQQQALQSQQVLQPVPELLGQAAHDFCDYDTKINPSYDDSVAPKALEKQPTQSTSCEDDNTYSPKVKRCDKSTTQLIGLFVNSLDDSSTNNRTCTPAYRSLNYIHCKHPSYWHDPYFRPSFGTIATAASTSAVPIFVSIFAPSVPHYNPEDFTGLHISILITSLVVQPSVCGLYDTFIVTSPNAAALWAPPLGHNRIMFLHSDLRYGDDDPLSWPQPYVHQYCHLAVIRSPPLNLSRSHPDAPLHWLPGGNDFREADSAVNIITEKARGTTLSDGAEDLKCTYMLLLHDFLECLEHLPMSLEKVQLNVRETQLRTADSGVTGAFTTNMQIAQDFFQAGIPVWIIHTVDQLSTIHIDNVEHFRLPSFFLSLEQHRAKFQPVFKGHGATAEKYYAFNRFTRSHIRFPNVFAWTDVSGQLAPPLNLPSAPVASSSSSRKDQKRSPYARHVPNKPSTSSGSLKLFVDRTPAHPFLPPIIAVWACGLSNLVFDKTCCIGSASIKLHGYALPPPTNLTIAENPLKIEAMFKFWLHIRLPMFARLSSPLYLPSVLDQNSWKMFLSLDYLAKANEQENPTTKAAVRRAKMKEILAGCFNEIEVELGSGEGTSVSWRGKAYEMLTATDHQEIVWEMSEIAFRLELATLDCMAWEAGPNHDISCETAVSSCFTGPISMADIGSANMGLAYPSWYDRAPYLCSLRRLMQTWMGSKPDIIAKDMTSWLWTEAEILELEKVLADYYVDTFFLHFGCPPTLPQYLPHNPTTSFVPIWRIRGQTATPNVHADISKWE